MSVGVAIVGLGWIGTREARMVATRANATLVGGVDTDADARLAFRSSFDAPCFESLEALFQQTLPDGVVVATPNAAHYSHARRVLEMGADVLVEKPMVTDVNDARALVRLADRMNGAVYVGYHRRFHPGFRRIRTLLDEGKLGRLRTCDCHLGQAWLEPNRDGWRTGMGADGGGMLFDTGSHLLEILFWLLDGTPEEVTGLVTSRENGVDVDSGFVSEFDRPRGKICLTLGFSGDSTGFDPDEQIALWGTKGRLVYTREPAGTPPHEELRVIADDRTISSSTFDEGVDSEALTDAKLGAFIDAIQTGETRLTTARDALELAAFRAAAVESAETGTRMKISDFK